MVFLTYDKNYKTFEQNLFLHIILKTQIFETSKTMIFFKKNV